MLSPIQNQNILIFFAIIYIKDKQVNEKYELKLVKS